MNAAHSGQDAVAVTAEGGHELAPTRVTMTVHDAVARALRDAADDELEVAGVLIVSVSETPGEVRLLVREFHPAVTYDYRSATELKLASTAYLPAVRRAAKLKAAAIFVHSHPGADPRASERDDVVDELLRPVFQSRTGSPIYGSMVLRMDKGNLSFTGRIWRDEVSIGPIVLLRELGEQFRFTSAFDAPEPLPAPAVFGRQVLAFGNGVQQVLHSLHIGVVGVGGTGSPITEQLVRAGVGTITVVDYQDLEDTNVTRVYGSSMRQVGMRKVDVAAASAAWIGLETVVNRVPEKISRSVLESLQACDIIFACTDDHSGRFDVSRLAYWCLIPVFDLGAQLDPVDSSSQGIYSRVDIQMPGTPCALCSGRADPERMRVEGLPDDEREELEREGYLEGQGNPDPAVIAFTTMAASLGFSELLLRLTGLADGAPWRLLYRVHDRRLARVTASPDTTHWCRDPLVWGAVRDGNRYLGAVWP